MMSYPTATAPIQQAKSYPSDSRWTRNSSELLPDYPHDAEAERALLEHIMADPSVVLHACFTQGLRKSHFYLAWNQVAYGILLNMHREGAGIDRVTFEGRLRDCVGERDFDNYIDAIGLSYEQCAGGFYQPLIERIADKAQTREKFIQCRDLIDAIEEGKSVTELEPELARLSKVETFGCHYPTIDLSLADTFDSRNDPDCLLGHRWLCKGGSCIWVGQSGIGKSALLAQAAISWALGQSFFGVKPVRPLKSLIIQAENDNGDVFEQIQGVAPLFGMTGATLQRTGKITMMAMADATGEKLLNRLRGFAAIHRPDLIWLDPLFSYAGCDISTQREISPFLRDGLSGIMKDTGVTIMLVHHTTKPKDSKDAKNAPESDLSYIMAGSNELTNWARAVVVVQQLKEKDDEGDTLYKLTFAKRGKRAEARELGDDQHPGSKTTEVFLKHSPTGICWMQVPSPAATEKQANTGGPPSKVDMILAKDLGPFFAIIPPGGEGKNRTAKRLEAWIGGSDEPLDVSAKTCGRALEMMVESKILKKTQEGNYIPAS